jgi:uncharacterized integral membrane protein
MKRKYIEIFGDMIYFKDLIISILLISTTTMVLHLFAPANNRPLGLLFGLAGTMIGFVIVMFFIKVKRVIKMENNHD